MAKQWALSGNAENVDWSDTAESGRAYADNLIGEPVISKVMHMMADEIERLRLTDAEREAVEWVIGQRRERESWVHAALRGLLERLGTTGHQ